MGKTLKAVQEGFLATVVEEEGATKHSGAYTRLPKDEFARMMTEERDGAALLDVLESENRIVEQQGHVHGYLAGDPHPDHPDNPRIMLNARIYFDVPDWTRLVAALRAFHETCGPY